MDRACLVIQIDVAHFCECALCQSGYNGPSLRACQVEILAGSVRQSSLQIGCCTHIGRLMSLQKNWLMADHMLKTRFLVSLSDGDIANGRSGGMCMLANTALVLSFRRWRQHHGCRETSQALGGEILFPLLLAVRCKDNWCRPATFYPGILQVLVLLAGLFSESSYQLGA